MRYIRLYQGLLQTIYFCAFISIINEFRGLYTSNGLLPVKDKTNHEFTSTSSNVRIHHISQIPNLQKIADQLGVHVDAFCLVTAFGGLLCSLITLSGKDSVFLRATKLFAYMSLIKVGGTFMSFQWDTLLLECGALSLLFFEIFDSGKNTSKTSIFLWCHRFLVFKLMFSAGVVKLQSLCPTWENLTALEYHFATQCIPNPVSWIAHQLPPVILRIGVAATLLIEIPFALLLITPFRILRRFSVTLQLLLQVLILLTGNYNFFNLLTIALMIPAWADDESSECEATEGVMTGSKDGGDTLLISSISNQLDNQGPILLYLNFLRYMNTSPVGRWLQVCACVIFTTASVSWMLRVDLTSDAPWWTGDHISLAVKWHDLQPYMQWVCGGATIVCVAHCGCNLVQHLHCMLTDFYSCSTSPSKPVINRRNFFSILHVSVRLSCGVVYGLVSIMWILLSARMLGGLCDMNPFIPQIVHHVSQYPIIAQSVSGYGLFRRMTGVGRYDPPTKSGTDSTKTGTKNGRNFPSPGRVPASGDETSREDHLFQFIPSVTARPEIVLEGFSAASNTWLEIPFRYKPTDLYRAPPFVVPHQPRLDWQMWFAALGNYQSNPWFVHLVYKLLHMDRSNTTAATNTSAASSTATDDTTAEQQPSSFDSSPAAVADPTNNDKEGTLKKKAKKAPKAASYSFPEVLALLDAENYPFKLGDPPKAIRATLYDYDFTRIDTPWSRANPHAELLSNKTTFQSVLASAFMQSAAAILQPVMHAITGKKKQHRSTPELHSYANMTSEEKMDSDRRWWYRRNPREYLPPIEADNPSIEAFLKAYGIQIRPYQSPRKAYSQCIALGSKGGQLSSTILKSTQSLNSLNSVVDLLRNITTTFVELQREEGGGKLIEDVMESSKRLLQTMVCSTLTISAAVSKLSHPTSNSSNNSTSIYNRLVATVFGIDILSNFDTTQKLLIGIVCLHIFTQMLLWLLERKKRRK